ncbi:unnamed protein product [Rotaria magnacalcarata]|uniref:Nuclear receptor domain-containing protein n=2 Tax=Rotaria magnacalcarata TaxID=392030 RepID=A0A815ZWW8_9BILA|nr:unnamed protein product [Rotaria magnacalcarata]CAF1590604.1 unnamed protein product [Rotaria magnacalcarata]CAF4544470.1 unnamed protein product [Rotaria magnacalcarata]
MQSTGRNNVCQVCGDYAVIVNYGVLSCLPCRTFFRRNAYRSHEIAACRHAGHCEMNSLRRKFCLSCRLAKCFTMGMSTNLIRKTNSTKKKRTLSISNDENLTVVTIPQESALDRSPGAHNLTLNPSDRIIISNVVHAFDAFSGVSQMRRILEAVKKSAYNFQYNLCLIIEFLSSYYNCVQAFISSIPDFKILTSTEQISLFQRNLLGVLCGCTVCLLNESGVFDTPENELVFSLLYDTEVTLQSKNIVQKLNYDPVVTKLMLVCLAFSSNCYMVNNHGNINQDSLLLGTFRLFGSQNAYVEVCWKYLLEKYGFNHAVKLYSNLIKQLLDTFSVSIDMYNNNILHRIFLDALIQQTETLSIVDKNSTVPLWGKLL